MGNICVRSAEVCFNHGLKYSESTVPWLVGDGSVYVEVFMTGRATLGPLLEVISFGGNPAWRAWLWNNRKRPARCNGLLDPLTANRLLHKSCCCSFGRL